MPKLVPESVLGTIGYYRWRYQDFMERHTGLSEPDPLRIPDYYLGYGEKYVIRFTRELYPTLSDKGKEWLIKARFNLQWAIESRCKSEPSAFAKLEEHPDKFREFAFNSHVAAYMDAGLANIPFSDLLKIASTPDFKDIIRKDGRSQIFSISRRLGREYLKRLIAIVRHAHKCSGEAVREGDFHTVEQAIDFVENLSSQDMEMASIITRNFRELHQALQFQIIQNSSSDAWNRLLIRLENMNRNE
ncbi:MAG: hypothetical protein HQM10_21990 [Candidatus Riflebacteria bacterium]|nr:hypothetical protein [Candidatus Riflebacteria bacterium]